MASGRRPFTGATGAEVAAEILTKAPPPLERIRTDLPATLVRIVGHCLEKDPRRRVQSAADLRYELSDLAEQLRTRPGSQTPERLAAGPLGKRRLVSISALAAVLLALAGAALVLKPFSSKPALAKPIQSLAVLPLKNYSGDASQDYFSDGMTDALISNLAQIRALKVISRTSAMQYKDSKKPLGQIARELGVEGIVEGSVVRSGSRVRVTAQLVHAAQDRSLWASNYEREMTDILSLQSEVVRTIAGEIRIQVTPQENQQLASQRRVDPGAYEALLKGRFLLERGTNEKEFRAAIDLFKRATELDPPYAPGWAGLAEATWTLAATGFEFVPPGSVRDPALRAARKALDLDDRLPEAHNARALISIDGEWDTETAERHFKRALELRPGYAAARNWYGQLLFNFTTRFDEAREHLKIAREIDPFSPWNDINDSAILVYERKLDLAVAEAGRALVRSPGGFVVRWIRGQAYLAAAKPDLAVADFEATIEPSGRNLNFLAHLGLAYGSAGRHADARRILRELQDLSKSRYVSPYQLACVHLGLGEKEDAYRALARGFEERTPYLVLACSRDPVLSLFRSDPRFEELLTRICRAVKLPGGT